MTLANQACPKVQFCKRNIFDFKESSTDQKLTSLKLIIDKDYVVYVEDVVSYDFQSFFGEVGGTLGLLLGISLSHIFEFVGCSLKHGITKWLQRNKKVAFNLWI